MCGERGGGEGGGGGEERGGGGGGVACRTQTLQTIGYFTRESCTSLVTLLSII